MKQRKLNNKLSLKKETISMLNGGMQWGAPKNYYLTEALISAMKDNNCVETVNYCTTKVVIQTVSCLCTVGEYW